MAKEAVEDVSVNVVISFSVMSVRLEDSLSVTEQDDPACASPGSSSSPFVIITFSESRFGLSDTSRGSC